MLLLLAPRAFASRATIFYSTKGRSNVSRLLFRRIESERKEKKRVVKVIQRVEELYNKYEQLIEKEDLTEQEIRFVTSIRKRITKEIERVNHEDEALVLLLIETGFL